MPGGNPMPDLNMGNANAPGPRDADPDYQNLVRNSAGTTPEGLRSYGRAASDKVDSQFAPPTIGQQNQTTPTFQDYAPREQVARDASLRFAREGGAASGWGQEEQARNTVRMGQQVANSPMIGRPSDPALRTLEQGQLAKFSGGPAPTFAPGDWKTADRYRGTGLPMAFGGTIPQVPSGHTFNPLTGSILPNSDVVRAVTGGRVEYGPHSLTQRGLGVPADQARDQYQKYVTDLATNHRGDYEYRTDQSSLTRDVQQSIRNSDRDSYRQFKIQQINAKVNPEGSTAVRNRAQGQEAIDRGAAAKTTADANKTKADTGVKAEQDLAAQAKRESERKAGIDTDRTNHWAAQEADWTARRTQQKTEFDAKMADAKTTAEERTQLHQQEDARKVQDIHQKLLVSQRTAILQELTLMQNNGVVSAVGNMPHPTAKNADGTPMTYFNEAHDRLNKVEGRIAALEDATKAQDASGPGPGQTGTHTATARPDAPAGTPDGDYLTTDGKFIVTYRNQKAVGERPK